MGTRPARRQKRHMARQTGDAARREDVRMAEHHRSVRGTQGHHRKAKRTTHRIQRRYPKSIKN